MNIRTGLAFQASLLLVCLALGERRTLAEGEEPEQETEAEQPSETMTEEAAAPEPPAPRPLAAPRAAIRRAALERPEAPEEEPASLPHPRRTGAPRPAEPAPVPTGTPAWDPGDSPIPSGAHCVVKPPKLAKIKLVIHGRPRPGKVLLDSTPIVCDKEFCVAVGFTNRNCCPLGAEGSKDRVACELLVLGTDPDDGLPGPHWMFQGNGGIWKHGENPFLAFVKFPAGGGGTATVCSNVKPVV